MLLQISRHYVSNNFVNAKSGPDNFYKHFNVKKHRANNIGIAKDSEISTDQQ